MPIQIPPVDIVIENKRSTYQAPDGSFVYEGDVVVRYGLTKLTADRLTYFPKQERGIAEGHVILVDPAGTAYADRLEFDGAVGKNTGRGTNVTIRVGNGILKAREVQFTPEKWDLFDVEGTTCFRPAPVYYVTSDKVTISTGKQATIHQPRVSFLGKFIAELPTQRASLIPAVPGIGYPAPRYKIGRGLGVTWNGGLLIGKQSTFNFNAGVYTGKVPTALTQYTYSFLPLDKATQVVAPRSDFNERYAYGFLNSIRVDSPEDEMRYLRARRSSFSTDLQVRGSIADRNRGQRYNKIEGLYQVGGAEKGLGYLAEARLQGIQPLGDDIQPRLKLVGSVALPTLSIRRNLSLISRLDSEGFLGKTGYGWIQATSGVSYLLHPSLRLSAGGFASADLGTPQFAMDPLRHEKGFLARTDLKNGGLTFTYLIKHEPGRGTYDHEFAFTQVIGCFEAFYSKREFPRSRNIGLTIRVQPFVDLLKTRVAEVTGKKALKVKPDSTRP